MTFDAIEVLWFTVAVIGTVSLLLNLFDALGDWRVARGNPDIEPLGRMSVRAESFRLGQMVSFLLAGAMALGSSPQNSPRLLIIAALIVGHILLMLNGVLDKIARRKLLARRLEGTSNDS
jgi:hypothetical protein